MKPLSITGALRIARRHVTPVERRADGWGFSVLSLRHHTYLPHRSTWTYMEARTKRRARVIQRALYLWGESRGSRGSHKLEFAWNLDYNDIRCHTDHEVMLLIVGHD